jgi:20S proteasome alpha/beta subunit
MTISITISTYDGIVIASDSRLLCVNDNFTIDNAQKIFIMNHKVCITIANDIIKDCIDLRQSIRDYIDENNHDKSIGDVVCDFYSEFASPTKDSDFKNFDTFINIIGYDADYNPQSILIKTKEYPAEKETLHGYFINIIHPESEEMNVYIKNIYEEYTDKASELGVLQGIELCKLWIKETAKIHNDIGGSVDIILMTKDKTRWIKNKSLKQFYISQLFQRKIKKRS